MSLTDQLVLPVEIGKSARHPANTMKPSAGEEVGFELSSQQRTRIGVERCEFVEERAGNTRRQHPDAVE
jgi:hypothetical protein